VQGGAQKEKKSETRKKGARKGGISYLKLKNALGGLFTWVWKRRLAPKDRCAFTVTPLKKNGGENGKTYNCGPGGKILLGLCSESSLHYSKIGARVATKQGNRAKLR